MSSGEQISPYRDRRSDAGPALGTTGGTMTNEMADAYEISEAHRSRSFTRLGIQEVPDGWTLTTVGEACSIENEMRLPLSVDVRATMSGKYPYYGPTGILSYIDEYRVEGDFALIGEDGDHFLDFQRKLQTIRVTGKFNVNNHAHIVGPGEQCLVDWFYFFFQHRDITHSITRQGAGRYKLTKSALERLSIVCPSIPEQQRIASILRTWDEAIEKLNAMILSADRQLSAVRQHLFESVYRSRKGLERARAIFETVSEKARPDLPLLAVMQDIGIVRRDELDRRVAMPDGETSGYKVVQPGNFVISLRSFEGGLELSNVLGLVSPAYTVLRPMRKICVDYFKHYFKSRSFIGRLDKMIFGIRDGKQIAFRDFGDMHIPCPSMEVQKAHALILNSAAQTIETNRKLKTALENQKRGLMQKLLTGKWRVTV